MFLTSDLLPLLVFLPLAWSVFQYFGPREESKAGTTAVIVSLVFGALAVYLGTTAMGLPEGLAWVGPTLSLGLGGFDVPLRLYLDGRNAPFILLLGLAVPFVLALTRPAPGSLSGKSRSFFGSAAALTAGLAGVFISDTLLLFYLFWEASLLAVYFWIGIHGKSAPRTGEVYGVLMRFVLLTLAGSLPMLLGLGAVMASRQGDPGISGLAAAVGGMSPTAQGWVFFAFLLGFAVKLPFLGLHGWLRDTYAVAPAACRALLSAAMSKMGAYGLILILAPAFPDQIERYAAALQLWCVAAVLYGALICLAQERLVDLLAYSSLSHLGLLALGVFAGVRGGDAATTGLTGAVFQAFNHGLIMALLFVLDARALKGGESPTLGALSGLRASHRRLAALLLTGVFASASLPGFSNFVGEILVYFAAFQASPWLVLLAGIGALIGAAALVRAFHGLFFGKPGTSASAVASFAPDLARWEAAAALALILLWVALGLYPMPFLGPVEKSLLMLNPRGWTG